MKSFGDERIEKESMNAYHLKFYAMLSVTILMMIYKIAAGGDFGLYLSEVISIIFSIGYYTYSMFKNDLLFEKTLDEHTQKLKNKSKYYAFNIMYIMVWFGFVNILNVKTFSYLILIQLLIILVFDLWIVFDTRTQTFIFGSDKRRTDFFKRLKSILLVSIIPLALLFSFIDPFNSFTSSLPYSLIHAIITCLICFYVLKIYSYSIEVNFADKIFKNKLLYLLLRLLKYFILLVLTLLIIFSLLYKFSDKFRDLINLNIKKDELQVKMKTLKDDLGEKGFKNVKLLLAYDTVYVSGSIDSENSFDVLLNNFYELNNSDKNFKMVGELEVKNKPTTIYFRSPVLEGKKVKKYWRVVTSRTEIVKSKYAQENNIRYTPLISNKTKTEDDDVKIWRYREVQYNMAGNKINEIDHGYEYDVFLELKIE